MKKIIDLFKTGKHDDRYGIQFGQEYTEKDLNDFIKATEFGKLDIIPITITHDSKYPIVAGVPKSNLFIQKQIDPKDGKEKSFLRGIIDTGAEYLTKEMTRGYENISMCFDKINKNLLHIALVDNPAVDLPTAFSGDNIIVSTIPLNIQEENNMTEQVLNLLNEIKSKLQFSKPNKNEDNMDEKAMQAMIDNALNTQKVEFEKAQNTQKVEFEKFKTESETKIKALETERAALLQKELTEKAAIQRVEFSAYVKKLVEDKKVFKRDEDAIIEIGMKLISAGEVQFSKEAGAKPESVFEKFKTILNGQSLDWSKEQAAGGAPDKVEFSLPDGIRKEDITPEMLEMFVDESKKRAEKK